VENAREYFVKLHAYSLIYTDTKLSRQVSISNIEPDQRKAARVAKELCAEGWIKRAPGKDFLGRPIYEVTSKAYDMTEAKRPDIRSVVHAAEHENYTPHQLRVTWMKPEELKWIAEHRDMYVLLYFPSIHALKRGNYWIATDGSGSDPGLKEFERVCHQRADDGPMVIEQSMLEPLEAEGLEEDIIATMSHNLFDTLIERKVVREGDRGHLQWDGGGMFGEKHPGFNKQDPKQWKDAPASVIEHCKAKIKHWTDVMEVWEVLAKVDWDSLTEELHGECKKVVVKGRDESNDD